MQGQYGAKDDKRLRDVAREMWRDWGFRKGVMRGYWVGHFAVCLQYPTLILRRSRWLGKFLHMRGKLWLMPLAAVVDPHRFYTGKIRRVRGIITC